MKTLKLLLLSSFLIPTFSSVMIAQAQLGQDLQGLFSGDWFGYSVAMSVEGNRVAIGAPGVNAGYVTVYQLQQGNWIQMGDTVRGKEDFTRFGESVSLSGNGNRLVVTSSEFGVNCRPYIRTYEWDGEKWEKFNDDMDWPARIYSKAMAISRDGETLITGDETDNGDRGRVAIMRLNGINAWTGDMGVHGLSNRDHLGSAVAISDDGNRVIIGAGDFNDHRDFAVAYEDKGGTLWDKIGEVISEDPDGEFGRAVSISGNGERIAVGSPTNSGAGLNAGSVRVYEYNFGRWEQVGSDIDGLNPLDHFGRNVALNINGKRLVVAAGNQNTDAGDNTGSIYVFDERNGNWVQVGQEFPGTGKDDRFGSSLAISSNGERFIAGSFLNDDNGRSAGLVRVYDMRLTPTNITNELIIDLQLFPNPSQGKFVFKGSLVNQIELIQVYDMMGKLVANPLAQNHSLDLSNLAEGIYVIQFILKEGIIHNQKVKVQRD